MGLAGSRPGARRRPRGKSWASSDGFRSGRGTRAPSSRHAPGRPDVPLLDVPMHAIFILCPCGDESGVGDSLLPRSVLSANALPPLGRWFATDGRNFARKFEAFRVCAGGASFGSRARALGSTSGTDDRSHRRMTQEAEGRCGRPLRPSPRPPWAKLRQASDIRAAKEFVQSDRIRPGW